MTKDKIDEAFQDYLEHYFREDLSSAEVALAKSAFIAGVQYGYVKALEKIARRED